MRFLCPYYALSSIFLSVRPLSVAMNRLLRVVLLLCTVSFAFSAQAQVLESAQLIEQYDVQGLQSLGIPNAENGVAVYKLRYWTPDVDGNLSIASAAMVSPDLPCAVPLVCFIHGTMFLKENAPSQWYNTTGTSQSGLTLGALGLACVLPDLLGLGDSPGLHPYLIASTSARTSMDAVRAAREFQAQLERPLNGQLFLMGVSAGGQTCMATNQAMQEQFPEEFQVTASVSISGPLVMDPTMRSVFLQTQAYGGRSAAVYAWLSYKQAYPELFSTISDIFIPPYDVSILPYFDGTHDSQEINQAIPNAPGSILQPVLKQAMQADPGYAVNLRIRENNTYTWTPQNPIRLYYCGGDVLVPPNCSKIAFDSLVARGAQHAELIESSATAGHEQCGALSRPQAYAWFKSLSLPCDDCATDSDGDLTPDCNDHCPTDPLKTDPGTCGCGVADTDTDLDGTA
ncbi:MAG: alpha/beta fold hydrolase, partial [Flavobacteriales bacterium]